MCTDYNVVNLSLKFKVDGIEYDGNDVVTVVTGAFLNAFSWYNSPPPLLCLNLSGDISTHVVHLHGIFSGLAVSTKKISRTK